MDNPERYSIVEAAALIAEGIGEIKPASILECGKQGKRLLQKLWRAAESNKLPAYKKGEFVRLEFSQAGTRVDPMHEFCWHDLNSWLDDNEPAIAWRFSEPGTIVAKKVGTNKKKWGDAELKALWEESIMPGVTQASLATKHGVKPQRISKLLKDAKEKFSTIRARSGVKNSYRQLITKT